MSTEVNNVRNKGEHLVEPVDPDEVPPVGDTPDAPIENSK